MKVGEKVTMNGNELLVYAKIHQKFKAINTSTKTVTVIEFPPHAVSHGYFMIKKAYMSKDELASGLAELSKLGYYILTDNRYIVFGKHVNSTKHVIEVTLDMKQAFPTVSFLAYNSLESFFEKNNL